jgi:hypothetical protein
MSDPALTVDDVVADGTQFAGAGGGAGGNFAGGANTFGGAGRTPNNAVSAAVSRERRRAIASTRSALVVLSVFQLVALGLALGMLLCLGATIGPLWTTWEFWRHFLTIVGLVVPMFMLDLVSRTCEPCGTGRPNIVGIIFLIVHIVWCIVITGFVINDMLYCSTKPWCISSSGSMSIFFMLWAIGFWAALVIEIIMVFVAMRLHGLANAGCGSRCEARLVARGYTVNAPINNEFMHMAGARAPVSISPAFAERSLIMSEADLEDLKRQ